jgi:hypothetical protein
MGAWIRLSGKRQAGQHSVLLCRKEFTMSIEEMNEKGRRRYTSLMANIQLPVLDRLIDPFARSLTPAAARAIVAFRADRATQARIDELADKCNEGLLTAKERAEYESFVRAIDFISTLQSRARRVLAQKRKA